MTVPLGAALTMCAVDVDLPNGDMALVDGDQPAFWEARTPSDAARTLMRDTDVAHSGEASLQIHNRDHVRSRWRIGHLRTIHLETGTEAAVSGWIRTNISSGSAFLTLYGIAADGEITGQPRSKGLTGTTDWTQIHHPVRIPDRTAYVMVYLELHGVGTAWFDDISLSGTLASGPPDIERPTTTIGPEDFRRLEGFARYRRLGHDVIGLSPAHANGRAEAVFWGPTARYRLRIRYMDERDGASTLTLAVNQRPLARIVFADTPADHADETVLRRVDIPDVDIQRKSRIILHGAADEGEYCRVLSIEATVSGMFSGTLAEPGALRLPPSLIVFENPHERRTLQGQHTRIGNQAAARAAQERKNRLEACDSPDDWRAYQKSVRENLTAILGDFGPTCELATRCTGRIERPNYHIENLVFESHPDYFVTANLYIPSGLSGKAPGVLFTCGHAADGKAYHLYHECCLGLVLKGYVVLALDPTGQGERSEYVDPMSGEDLVPRCVAQHHYAGRPAWLVGRSLAGYRTWDCMRAVDLLVSRPEVDADRIAAVGNSGGGQMALLIAAADERIAVCAAAHPGGSMENTYLTGQGVVDRDLLALIAPRPCVFIVGDKSGESWHRTRYKAMIPVYEGLGASTERIAHTLVDGVHDMKRPKREAAYAWLNRWFDRDDVQDQEPELAPESVEALHCTATGCVQTSLGGHTIASLNLARAHRIRPRRARPEPDTVFEIVAELRRAATACFGLSRALDAQPVAASLPVHRDTIEYEELTIRKLVIAAEPDISLPAVLIEPPSEREQEGAGVVYVSQRGKPRAPEDPSLPMALARRGLPVLAVDVRGSGECDPRLEEDLPDLRHYHRTRFGLEAAAVRHVHAGTTMCAWQSADVRRAIDAYRVVRQRSGRDADARVFLVGEGTGGIWGLLAAASDDRVSGVVAVDMVPSYLDLLQPGLYEASDYQMVPHALRYLDLSELPALCAPRPVLMINPVDARLQPMPKAEAALRLQWSRSVFQAMNAADAFTVVAGLDTPGRMADCIMDTLRR